MALLTLQGCASGAPEEREPGRDGPVSLVLTRPPEADGSVWLQEWDAESQPRWVAVRGPGTAGMPVFLREQCAIPDCGGAGGVCGMALPTVRRLDPGDSIRMEWDGRTSRTSEEDRCELREPVSPGEYVVEFCWAEEEPAAADPIDGPVLRGVVCRTRTAELPGVSRVAMAAR